MSYTFGTYDTNTSTSLNSVSSNSVTFVGGNIGIASIYVGNSSQQTVSSVADTLSNVWVHATGSSTFNGNVFGGTAIEIWYCLNLNAGTTNVTASWPSAGGYGTIQTVQYTPSSTITFDKAAVSFGNGTAPSLSLTPATSSGLVVVSCQTTGTSELWSAPFTDRTGGTGSLNFADASATGSGMTASASGGTPGDWVASMASFSIGAPAPTTRPAQVIFMGW